MAETGNNSVTTSVKSLTYEIVWNVKNMGKIFRDYDLADETFFELRTEHPPDTTCTWKIGLTESWLGNRPPRIDIYCLLSEINGCFGKKIEASFECESKETDGSTYSYQKWHLEPFEVGTEAQLFALHKHQRNRFLESDNSVNLYIKLTFPSSDVTPSPSKQIEESRWNLAIRSTESLREKMEKLFSEMEKSDVIIIASDKAELHAHRFILQMQNPVFESMLRSELSEGRSGIIKVDDICGKTMEIILRYLYTGDLLPSWSVADIIVEFTYAAGKYQLTEVLKMLDDSLGKNMSDEDNSSIMPLLSLASKLSLKKAERRLLELCRQKAYKADSAEELFAVIAAQANNLSSVFEPGRNGKTPRT